LDEKPEEYVEAEHRGTLAYGERPQRRLGMERPEGAPPPGSDRTSNILDIHDIYTLIGVFR
jgi:hypothetical protein